jgi:hypothetical protein
MAHLRFSARKKQRNPNQNQCRVRARKLKVYESTRSVRLNGGFLSWAPFIYGFTWGGVGDRAIETTKGWISVKDFTMDYQTSSWEGSGTAEEDFYLTTMIFKIFQSFLPPWGFKTSTVAR